MLLPVVCVWKGGPCSSVTRAIPPGVQLWCPFKALAGREGPHAGPVLAVTALEAGFLRGPGAGEAGVLLKQHEKEDVVQPDHRRGKESRITT